jgi:uncharacterized protein YprB with RNaseH-like and TPR domain
VTASGKLVPAIPGLIKRGQVQVNQRGTYLEILLPLEEIWPGGERLLRKRHQTLREGGLACAQPAPELQRITAAFPGDLLLLDLETCGLAGSALFLVGVLRQCDRGLMIELLLARNYAEEPAVLRGLWTRVTSDTVLATFNGKSFDWPMVEDRTARHLLFRQTGPPPRPQHVDLLHAARREWKHRLADCKLQTLEREICGRKRSDDIAGHRIPAAYADYVRTGFARDMDSILMHNALDLVTLLDLAMRLAQPVPGTDAPENNKKGRG